MEGSSRVRDLPRIMASPEVGGRRPVSIEMVVDLPALQEEMGELC